MENNEMSYSVFDNMIYHEPMRWQTIATDIEGNIFFLNHLNNYIKNYPIYELVGDDIPDEYLFLFEESSPDELKEVRNELLSCLN